MEKSIRIHPLDNGAVALTDLHAGETVAGITLREDVPAGHKVALAPLHPGDKVIKYGCPIGHATVEVAPGRWLRRTFRSSVRRMTASAACVPRMFIKFLK